MTEDMESALLGHVLDLKGDMEHVRSVAERTLEQATRTNGRVSQLEDWRHAHDLRIGTAEAHADGAREAHAEHAERHRRRRAAWARVFRFAFDNWQALAWVAGGIGVMALARWMP